MMTASVALLAELQRRWPETPTLLARGQREYQHTVRAVRGGSRHFVEKRFDRWPWIAARSLGASHVVTQARTPRRAGEAQP